MQSRRHGFSRESVERLKDAVEKTADNALHAYNARYSGTARINKSETQVDYGTAKMVLWLSGVGMCPDFLALTSTIIGSFSDFDCRLGESVPNGGREPRKIITLVPREDALVKLGLVLPANPQTSEMQHSGDRKKPGEKRGRSALRCACTILAVTAVVIGTCFAGIFSYTAALKTLDGTA